MPDRLRAGSVVQALVDEPNFGKGFGVVVKVEFVVGQFRPVDTCVMTFEMCGRPGGVADNVRRQSELQRGQGRVWLGSSAPSAPPSWPP